MTIQTSEKVWVNGTPRLWKQRAGGGERCPGCHYQIIERLFAQAVEEMRIEGNAVAISGVGCCSRIHIVLDIDGVFVAHGRAPDVATGLKRAHPELLIFTAQGDGDCISIGTESLIQSAVRSEKFTVVMINNAQYGTTGGQSAPTTLMGQVTSTAPHGRDSSTGYPIHAAELLSQLKGVAYSARGAVNTPANYQRTKKYFKTAMQKQMDGVGFGFLEILSTCPPNWHLTPIESLKWIEEQMITEFPLGEFKNVPAIE